MNNSNEKMYKGRVSAIHKNSYILRFEGKDISAKLKGSFREEEAENLPVVGDYVSFVYNENGLNAVHINRQKGRKNDKEEKRAKQDRIEPSPATPQCCLYRLGMLSLCENRRLRGCDVCSAEGLNRPEL